MKVPKQKDSGVSREVLTLDEIIPPPNHFTLVMIIHCMVKPQLSRAFPLFRRDLRWSRVRRTSPATKATIESDLGRYLVK